MVIVRRKLMSGCMPRVHTKEHRWWELLAPSDPGTQRITNRSSLYHKSYEKQLSICLIYDIHGSLDYRSCSIRSRHTEHHKQVISISQVLWEAAVNMSHIWPSWLIRLQILLHPIPAHGGSQTGHLYITGPMRSSCQYVTYMIVSVTLYHLHGSLDCRPICTRYTHRCI